MARRKHSKRRRGRGSFGFLYKLLSVLLICGAIIAAMTLFFRVGDIVVTGQKRYTAEEIQAASGVELGSNMYLLNKYDIVRAITKELPYIEDIRVNRKLPDTLLIEVRESGRPFALVQDGSAWLISGSGKIVEQLPESEAGQYGLISGCQLLAPSVGTQMALATEYASQQSSLLDLIAALDAAGLTENVDGIRLDDLSYLNGLHWPLHRADRLWSGLRVGTEKADPDVGGRENPEQYDRHIGSAAGERTGLSHPG